MDEKLKNIFTNLFNLESNAYHGDITRDDIQAWDSLNHLNLVMDLEVAFNISLTTEEVLEMKSVPDIKSVLERHAVVA
jgi:acyl carrier protein